MPAKISKKVSSTFERVCWLHSVLSISLAVLLYFQPLKEFIKILGVSSESSHSLRNTAFLFLLAAFISICVISKRVRDFVCSDTDDVLSFAAGLAALTNILLLAHLSVEAFVYHSVSQVSVLVGLFVTFCVGAGVRISIGGAGKHD